MEKIDHGEPPPQYEFSYDEINNASAPLVTSTSPSSPISVVVPVTIQNTVALPQHVVGYLPAGLPYDPDADHPDRILLYKADKTTRTMFFRKVFAIISGQMAMVCALISICIYIPKAQKWVSDIFFAKFWGIWISALIVCSLAIRASHHYQVMRKRPMDLALLIVMTPIAAILLATLSARLDGMEGILINVSILFCICLAAVLYTFQGRWPLTPNRALMSSYLMVGASFGILCAFYSVEDSLYLSIGTLAYTSYLCISIHFTVKDTYLRLRSNEYVYGAVKISLGVTAVIEALLRCSLEACDVCQHR